MLNELSRLISGFPDLTSHRMQGHIISDAYASHINSTILNFYKVLGDKDHVDDAIITHVFVYLINSKFGCADFEFTEHFPLLTSYRLEDIYDGKSKIVMKSLTLEFQKGTLSFSFENAFHALSSHPVGKPLGSICNVKALKK
jgi:hypothetical protein